MTNQPKKKLRKLHPKEHKNVTRVLYVEDAAVIRDTISRLLKLSGYEVAYAKNGEEGVEMTLSWKPDVVLMDLRMPVMDGYNAISEIKSKSGNRAHPCHCGHSLEQQKRAYPGQAGRGR